MKKLLLIACLLLPMTGFAQSGQFAHLDVLSPIMVTGATTAMAPVTTNHTTWEYYVIEPDGTNTAVTMGTGTSNNQCTARTLSLVCFITPDQTGQHVLSIRSTTQSIPLGFSTFYVYSGTGCFKNGSCVTQTAIETETDAIYNRIGAPAGASIAADIAAGTEPTVVYATAFSNFPIYFSNANGSGASGLSDITCKISKDGAAAATTNDTSEAEVDAGDIPGLYVIDLTSGETTATIFNIYCESASLGANRPYNTFVTPQR